MRIKNFWRIKMYEAIKELCLEVVSEHKGKVWNEKDKVEIIVAEMFGRLANKIKEKRIRNSPQPVQLREDEKRQI